MRIVLQLGGKPTRRPGRRGRRQAGLRLALLSLATVILLLGAAIVGIFCYESIGHGSPIAAVSRLGSRTGGCEDLVVHGHEDDTSM
jgi:hypothetical protein